MINDFIKYVSLDRGISSNTLERYGAFTARTINPTIIEERSHNVATWDVFSRLMMDRIIFLGAPIDNDVANIVTAQLLYLSSVDPKDEISIYLNTPGGSVSDGLSIYDTMQIVSPDIATICTGMAASMGSLLLCAGTQGKRSALPHSRVMIHQPLGGIAPHSQASDIIIHAQEIEKCRTELCRVIAHHTGKSYDEVFKDMDRDFWMGSDEAKAYGMIDTILSRK